MKRIVPRRDYAEDRGYPSVVDVDLSRRQFLGTTLAGAVGLGGALLLPDPAEAGRRHGEQRVSLPYSRSPSRCHYRLDKVVVQTHDRRLASFLNDAGERVGVTAVLAAVLGKVNCADLVQVSRRRRLEAAVASGLTRRYRKRTGRRSRKPTTRLVVSRRFVRAPLGGDYVVPTLPVVPLA